MAIIVNITYICDRCGKTKVEKPIMQKGYDDVDAVDAFVSLNDAGYVPNGWSYYFKNEKEEETVLLCKKCTNKDNRENESVAIA